MKTLKYILFIIGIANGVSQDVYYTEFPSRDFFVKNDTITFIEKRDVLIKPSSTNETYFIGGYGLELYDDYKENQIISVSNELLKTVCSVRFYNKASKKVEEVYYYHNGRAIDALHIKELNSIVLSLANNKILIVDYSKKPEFVITGEITLTSMARRLVFLNGKLYYGTDDGEIYQYNVSTKQNQQLHKQKHSITDIAVLDNTIIYSTINGEILKWGRGKTEQNKTLLKNNFVLNSLIFQENKLIFGTFNGDVLVVNSNTMTIERVMKHHDRSVLKIINYKDSIFYSSSMDKTIKKWIIK